MQPGGSTDPNSKTEKVTRVETYLREKPSKTAPNGALVTGKRGTAISTVNIENSFVTWWFVEMEDGQRGWLPIAASDPSQDFCTGA